MSTAQRVIRKVRRAPKVAFDERPMSTQTLLAVWAFLITLLVIGLGGFDETRILHNGWFRLAGVALTWGLLAWAATTPKKWMAQRLRLGVAASLCFHTLLMMLLVWFHLSILLTEPEPSIERLAITEPVETPTRVEVTQSAPDKQPVFETPVSTEQLTAEEEQPKVAKTQAVSSLTEEVEEESVEMAARPIPQSAIQRRPRTALTHRARSPGERSRQTNVATLAAAPPREIDPRQQIQTASITDLTPSPKALAKVDPSSPPDQPTDPTSEPQAPTPKVALRREREPLEAQPPPVAPREHRQPEHVAQAISPIPEPRQLASVTKTRTATEPVESTTVTMPRPSIAEPLETVVAQSVPPEPDHMPAPNPSRLRTRQQSMAMSNAAPNRTRQSAPEAPLTTQTSPAPASLAAAVPVSSTPDASTSPAPRVMADSRGGTAGRGDGLNAIDDAPAAPSYSAPFAAAAANRNRSTQTERGPALVPNPVAKITRARASAESPSATLQALPVPNAQVAGTNQPQETSASSSAAVDRQFANVSLGDITAAAGESEVDTGPPQIAPERGAGRGDRGGRMAMSAPTTQSGLGPRRAESVPLSPSSSAVAAVEGGARTSSTAAGVAPTNPTTAGARGESRPARLARAPSRSATTDGAQAPDEEFSPSSSGSVNSTPATGATTARRGSRADGYDGPAIAASGAPSRLRGAGIANPAAALSAVDPVAVALLTPLAVDLSPSRPSEAGPAAAVGRPTPVRRQTQVPDTPGSGGVASDPSRDPGLPRRIARRKTTTLRMTPGRYANRAEGGTPSPPGRARNPAPAFAARTDRNPMAPIAQPTDLTQKTEWAIELGLQFLARLQQDNGRWSFNEFGQLSIAEEELPSLRADGAATGLALLAFLGGGYDHFDDKYQATVQRGLDYLIKQQGERGDIFPERDLPGASVTRFYSHGIATLALCEAYGMTGDPTLREPAQRAIDYIIKTQHSGKHGWRYNEGSNSDLSVTGWQMMALRSGELAGLDVDKATYRRVRQFLERCRQTTGNKALFCYNPYTASTKPDQQHHNKPSTVMTSVGLLVQLYLGENRDSIRSQHGADHLLKNLPTHEGVLNLAPVGTTKNPQRDTYYWYYATQVMFHMGSDYWKQWHEHLYPLLIDQQTQEGELAGSWNPRHPVPDHWGPHAGRIYVTAMNLLSLEVSYRHLPLYEMTAE